MSVAEAGLVADEVATEKPKYIKPKSPPWAWLMFIILLLLISTWLIPTAVRVMNSNILLMKCRYTINLWINEKDWEIDKWLEYEKQLKAAKEIEPDNPEVLQYLGNLYTLRGLRANAHNSRFLTEAYLGEAYINYKAALEIKPRDALLWTNTASVLAVLSPNTPELAQAITNAKELGKNEQYLQAVLNKF